MSIKRDPFILLILAILILAPGSLIFGQSGEVAAGGEIQSGDFIMSYSVGQPVYTKVSQENIFLSQGLQHPNIKLFTKILEKKADGVAFSVYPNPASEHINIELYENNIQELKLVILSPEGKILIEEMICESTHTIAIGDLQAGTYILLISNGKKVLSSYKLIKQ